MVNAICQSSANVNSNVPDFVPVAKGIPLIFPKELMRQLNKCQLLILQLLTEVCAVIDAKTGKLVFRDLHPTEEWIAERLNYSREWVSKSLNRLARMGLVEIVRRRDSTTGKFKPNEYRLTKKTIALLVRFYNNYENVFRRKFVNSIKQKIKELVVWLNKNRNNPKWFNEREFTLADVIAAAYALKAYKINDPVIKKMLWRIVSEPLLREDLREGQAL